MWIEPYAYDLPWVRVWLVDHIYELMKYGANIKPNPHSIEWLVVSKNYFSEIKKLPTKFEEGKLLVYVPEEDVVFYSLKV